MSVKRNELPTHPKEDGSKNSVHITAALNLVWSYGINRHIPVLNLTTNNRKGIFYASAHTGVFFDFESNSQILYQGHCNSISCTCISVDKRWLVTADIGKDCMIIIWDTETSIPIKTIFDVDPVGVSAVAFSGDAKFVAVLSCTIPQVLSIWDWTAESESPCSSINLDPEYGLQTFLCFNINNAHQIVSNNGKQVVFYKWTIEGDIKISAPELDDHDFNKTVGNYTQSVFYPLSGNAVTATSCGNIVVWTIKITNGNILEAKALKIVKIQDKAISVLMLLNENIVAGDVTGNVKFFDLDLKLINCYSNFGSQGSINSISFSHCSNSIESAISEDKGYSHSAILKSKPFIVNDFSVSTTKAAVLYFKTEGSTVQFIRKHHNKEIKGIACHPKEHYIAIGGFDGLLQVIDFENKILKHMKQYSEKNFQITCISYSHTGDFLAVGFSNGLVQILDSVTLECEGKGNTVASFQFSHHHISKLAFSHDSLLLACCDTDMCVIVITFNPGNKETPWKYLGKHRAHYKQITDLMFIKSLDECGSRLLSIGEDRMLVEYDLKNSLVDDLKILSSNRIEQNALPICFVPYPPVVKEDFIVVASDQYKLKLFNSTTKMCRHTFLGPTYGSPLRQLVALPEIKDAPNRYMAYITKDKVGLIILPLDGNPHKSMALIAHPGYVHNVTASYDGQYIFTAGGADTTVLMWKVDIKSLEATASLGGEGLVPFYSLLEGGRDGELFAELESYFYYAQIRNQGVDAMSPRDISTAIPLSEIPYIIRALGYYPTEQEIDEMLNEVKFSEYVITGKCIETIRIGELVKLYVNHRPVFGLNPEDFIDAFSNIGYLDESDGEIRVNRNELLGMLQEKGEHLTESELSECIALLTGDLSEDIEDSENISVTPLDEALPEEVSLDFFTSDLLGFGVPKEISA